MKKSDVIVIGGGPAGLTAGLYSVRAGLETILIEKLATGGAVNLTPDVANFPGFTEISGFELGQRMQEQASAAGVEIVYDEIESVDIQGKTVKCLEGEFKAKALIIATGASPRLLRCDGEQKFLGSGVHTCALCDGTFYKGKDVVVAGGGNSAVEEAIYLSSIANSVTIVNITESFNAQQVLVDKLPKSIKVYHGYTVLKILGDKKVEGIEITNGKQSKTLKCNGLFVSIGRVPNSELFKGQAELSKGGYIVVDGMMQTSVQGVFAAGDVIEKNVRQIITACADGAVAATAALKFIK